MILYPPGTGKTRTVWHKIFQQKGSLKGKLRYSIAHTLIVGPNQEIYRIWLRELALYCLGSSKYKQRLCCEFPNLNEKAMEDKIRHASAATLAKKIKGTLLLEAVPAFKTYSQLSSPRIKRQNYQILILDEWHRAGNRLKQAVPESGCFAKVKAKKAVFFVSATPLNPVLLEKETDSILTKIHYQCQRSKSAL